jgi:hypothetical protein
VGEKTIEQFRTEFATEIGRRRLGYPPNAEQQEQVDRILADDVHTRQIYAQWTQRQQRFVEANRAAQRKRQQGQHLRGGFLLLLVGLFLAITFGNLAVDHVTVIKEPCHQEMAPYRSGTRTVCPAHDVPNHDGEWVALVTLSVLGGAAVVSGIVLMTRHRALQLRL